MLLTHVSSALDRASVRLIWQERTNRPIDDARPTARGPAWTVPSMDNVMVRHDKSNGSRMKRIIITVALVANHDGNRAYSTAAAVARGEGSGSPQ
jgi:hypothetical protein